MNLVLLLPAGLLGLAALLLPLLLHLARRSERLPTDFAALAWLTSHARPRRHVRFDEWPLLLVRLLLVALLALLLARPAFTGAGAPLPWVVAVPGVSAATLHGHPAPGSAQRRWLAPGWPRADAARPVAPQPVASLLRELDAALPAGAPLTVLVPPVIDGADAERPRLSRRVTWQVVAPASAALATTPRAIAPGPRPAPLPELVVRYRNDRLAQVRYLRATANAWRTGDRPAGPRDATAGVPAAPPVADIVAIDAVSSRQPVSPQARLLAWLVPGPVPAPVLAWITAGGTVLLDAEATLPTTLHSSPSFVAWHADDGSARLVQRALGRGRVLQWAQPLLPSAFPELLDADFPSRLRTILGPTPPAPRRADSRHYAPATGALSALPKPREVTHWLAMLAALLFVLERWLASGARRAPVPAPRPAAP